MGGTEYLPWDEAAEHEREVTVPLAKLLSGGAEFPFSVPGGLDEEDLAGPDGQLAGRLVRRWQTLSGVIRLSAERLPGPYGAVRLRLTVANGSEVAWPLTRRADGLPFALVAAHSLISVPGGRFLSMTDPPEWAAPVVSGCVNTGTWPVLGGPAGCAELVLSSPVILYDHPEIAAESAGQLYDSTEIDEILTLRTLTLTDAEKQQARDTDPRAAELLDRLDHLPPEMLERMHGAIRYLQPAGLAGRRVPDRRGPGQRGPGSAGGRPGRAARGGADPADRRAGAVVGSRRRPSVSPESDHVLIAGILVARGSRVRMCPGHRRADAQDLFLAGRTALVEAVLFDVDGQVHLALLPDDDPAADLQRSHGRFLYFGPDEVEPLGATS